MSRVLKRPMFRRGGSSNEGIMSKVKRQDYALGDLAKVVPTKQEMEEFRTMYPKYEEATSGFEDPLTKFLLSYGPALAEKTGGGTLQNLIAATKEPTKELYEDLRRKKEIKYSTESDLFKTLLAAKAEVLGGDSGTKFKDLLVGEEIVKLIPEISNLKEQLAVEKDADKRKELQNKLQIAEINLERYRKPDPSKTVALELFVKSAAGQNIFSRISENLFRKDPTKYKGDKNDPKLLADALAELEKFVKNMGREPEKEGGRVGYQMGGEAIPQEAGIPIAQTEMKVDANNETPNISYDQLRARLPQEITDDIVTLLSQSMSALEEFASIQTQQDVDNFNKKYSVNLVLPAEA
jgi:hypothetical protein